MANQHGNHISPVSITKTASVYPKTMHPPKLLNLSNLDRQCPLLMYMVFFYKPCSGFSNLSIGSVFSSLKKGLEETLSVWYPAAGRLRLNPDSNGPKKLDLWCNNDGAILVEAVTQAKITELGDLSEYNEFFENLVFKPVFNGDFSEMPLVVAQVTRFGCGGYSIGIGTSHSLFDGPATFDFMCAWSSSTKMTGIRVDLLQQHKPVHERGTLLFANCQTQKLTSNHNRSMNTMTRMPSAIEHLYHLIQQATINDQNCGGMLGGCSNQESINHVFKTFHLSSVMIETLKEKTSGGKRGGGFLCSSFELIAAHLWKSRTKALGVRKERLVCLQFAVDTRNKVAPPLPKGFSGNAYVLASVALTARELEEESYEALVKKIKEAKNSITNEYITSYIEALEAPQVSLPPLNELTIVSDWTRMPFHKVDFLNCEAACALPLDPPIPHVAYFMQNPSETRGIDVRIGLLPDTLNAFSQYFLVHLQ